jgi:hypothetical protein
MSRYEEPREVFTTVEYGRTVLSCEVFVSDEDLKSINVKPKSVSDEEMIEIADVMADMLQESAYKNYLKKAHEKVKGL